MEISHVCVFALLLSLASSEMVLEDGIVRIPIKNMESGLEKLFRQEADLKLIEGLYEMAREKSKPPKPVFVNGKPKPVPPSNDTLPMFKYFETQYYGVINIGKPGREFKMILDSAWGYSWVPSEECPRSVFACAVHNRYDHTRSSTYKPDGRPFLSGDKYVGYMSKDVFHAGHLNAEGQVFAELTKIPWIFTLFATDGTLGLGLKGLSANVVPFFYNFYTQNKLKPIFSLFVNRDPTTPKGGSLFLGGIDYKHNKTEFTTVPVTSDKYWQFQMDKVTLIKSKKSSQDFCKGGCTAVADTSSNTIIGPDQDIKTINTVIGANPIPFFSDRFLIPCNNEYKGPKVSFTIQGKEFIIKAQDYIQKLSYSGFTICLSAFQPNKNRYPDNTWSLGGAFLYQYYTAYDVENKKIMIAEAT